MSSVSVARGRLSSIFNKTPVGAAVAANPFDSLREVVVGESDQDEEEDELGESRDVGTDSRDLGEDEGQYDISLIDDMRCFDACHGEGVVAGIHAESNNHCIESIVEDGFFMDMTKGCSFHNILLIHEHCPIH